LLYNTLGVFEKSNNVGTPPTRRKDKIMYIWGQNIFVTLRRQWRISHIDGEAPNKFAGISGLDLHRAKSRKGETWYVGNDGYGFRQGVLMEMSALLENHPDHIHIYEPPRPAA